MTNNLPPSLERYLDTGDPESLLEMRKALPTISAENKLEINKYLSGLSESDGSEEAIAVDSQEFGKDFSVEKPITVSDSKAFFRKNDSQFDAAKNIQEDFENAKPSFTIDKQEDVYKEESKNEDNTGDNVATKKEITAENKRDYFAELELKNELANQVNAYNEIVAKIIATKDKISQLENTENIPRDMVIKILEMAELHDSLVSSSRKSRIINEQIENLKGGDQFKVESQNLQEELQYASLAAEQVTKQLEKLLQSFSDPLAAETTRNYINDRVNNQFNENDPERWATMCTVRAAVIRKENRSSAEKMIDDSSSEEQKLSSEETPKEAVEKTEVPKKEPPHHKTAADLMKSAEAFFANSALGKDDNKSTNLATEVSKKPNILEPLEDKNDSAPKLSTQPIEEVKVGPINIKEQVVSPTAQPKFEELISFDPQGNVVSEDEVKHAEIDMSGKKGNIDLSAKDISKLIDHSRTTDNSQTANLRSEDFTKKIEVKPNPTEAIKQRVKDLQNTAPMLEDSDPFKFKIDQDLKDVDNNSIVSGQTSTEEIPLPEVPINTGKSAIEKQNAFDPKADDTKSPDLVAEAPQKAQEAKIEVQESKPEIKPEKKKESLWGKFGAIMGMKKEIDMCKLSKIAEDVENSMTAKEEVVKK